MQATAIAEPDHGMETSRATEEGSLGNDTSTSPALPDRAANQQPGMARPIEARQCLEGRSQARRRRGKANADSPGAGRHVWQE